MIRALPITACLLFGCAFDAHRQGERCQTDDECAPGLICRDGLCRDGLPDQGGDDARPVDLSLPMDQRPALDARPLDLGRPADQAPPLDLAPPEQDLAPPMDLAPPVDRAPPPLPLPPSDPDVADRCGPDTRCFLVSRDTHIAEARPNRDYEGASTLEVRRSESEGERTWALLRFDLSGWREFRWPVACDLWLRRSPLPRDEPEVDLQLQQLVGTVANGNWVYPATWFRQPAPRPGAQLVRFRAVGPRQTQRLDVSAFMASLRDARGLEGLGLLIKFDPLQERGDDAVDFDSLDGRADAIPPYLECRYAP